MEQTYSYILETKDYCCPHCGGWLFVIIREGFDWYTWINKYTRATYVSGSCPHCGGKFEFGTPRPDKLEKFAGGILAVDSDET